MANDRPSNHPLGYWLAGTPASAPAHAWPDWLWDILGRGVAPTQPDTQQEEERQPTYPVLPGGNNALNSYGYSPRQQQALNILRWLR